MTREERIAEARRLEAKGLSRTAIARELGVANSTITKWFNPERALEYNRRANAKPKRKLAKREWDRQNSERRRRYDPTPPEGHIWVRGIVEGKVQVVGSTLVDADDWHRFRYFKWSLTNGYVTTSSTDGSKVYLHRLVLGLTEADHPLECDHINRNKRDNRKSNLRKVTRKENCANRGGMFEKSAAA